MRVVFIILSVIASDICNGQTRQIRVFDTDDGLPSPESYFIHQDYFGYYWIGTDRGLVKYDGYYFHNYTTQNSGLTCNTVFKCYSDRNNDLWFIGYNGEISIFQQSTQKFKAFKYNQRLQEGFKYWPSKIVFKGDNVLIFGTSDKYKYANYNLKADSFSYIGYANQVYLEYNMNSTIKGLSKFYFPTDSLLSVVLANCFNCLEKDNNDGRWPITNVVERNDTTFFAVNSKIYLHSKNGVGLYRDFKEGINYLYIDKSGGFFTLTTSGCYMETRNGFDKILDGFNLTGMIQDHEGAYWFSDMGRGIVYLPNIQVFSIFDNFLHGQIVTAMEPCRDGLLLGTNKEEAHIVDESQSITTMFNKFSNLSNELRILSFNRNNGQIFATGGYVFNESKEATTLIKLWTKSYSSQGIYINDTTYVSLPYSSGYAIHGSGDNWRKINTNGERLTSLALMKDGKLYFSSVNGLWVTHISNLLSCKKIDDKALLSIRINKLVVYDSILVMGTSSRGLLLMHGNNLLTFTEKDGLVSNFINTVSLYNGLAFVGTNKGISVIDLNNGLQNLKVKNQISASDGLESNFIYATAVWKEKIWVSTDKGLVTIPLTSHNVEAKPFIHLKTVRNLSNPSRNRDSFRYNENNVSFNFVGISSKKPEQWFYEYKLKRNGKETEVSRTNNTVVDFYNLKPGKYEFAISCKDKHNNWSDTEVCQFVILPHFTQTLEFKFGLILSLMIFSLYYIFWRTYKKQFSRGQNKFASSLSEGSRDAELIVLRSQMNPHFIFNALHSIQSYIILNDVKNGANYLKQFSDIMRTSLELSREKWITLDREINFLNTYLEIEKFRFPERFEFKVWADEDCDLESYLPPLLLQPIVENAVKYAFNSECIDGIIEVQFSMDNEFIRCTIRDNGVGIYSAKSIRKDRKSLGLQVVIDRLCLLKTESYYTDMTIIDFGLEKYKSKGPMKFNSGTEVTIILTSF